MEEAPVHKGGRGDSIAISFTSETIVSDASTHVPTPTEDTTLHDDALARATADAAAAVLKRHKKQSVFRGTGNAIAVQLFAIDEKYEMRLVQCGNIDAICKY